MTTRRPARRPLAAARALPLLALLSACSGVSHVAPYVPKNRPLPVPEGSSPADGAASPGSLWRDDHSNAKLFSDARALRENDLLVIKVEEIADANRSTDLDMNRKGGTTALMQLIQATSQQSFQLNGSSETGFKGGGSTARTEHLTATVPAIVKKVLPNGNLFVEGHRVVLVNNEEQHFYISGVVRPIDIDQENSVKSSMVAEAEIEFTGHGILTDQQHQGFLSKFWGWIWPF